MWRRLAVPLILSVLGLFGSLFPAVADIWPNSSIIDLFPTIGSLDSGFKSLTEFSDQTSDGKPIGILKENDPGFDKIYDLLRNINPGIPLRAEKAYGEKLILVQNILNWDTSRESISLAAVVHIYFRKDETAVPVCELGDLVAGIRDRKVAVWSSAGLAVVVIMFFMQQIISLRGNTSPPTKQPQTKVVIKPPLSITLKDETSGKRGCHSICYRSRIDFVLASLIGFALGILLSSKNK